MRVSDSEHGCIPAALVKTALKQNTFTTADPTVSSLFTIIPLNDCEQKHFKRFNIYLFIYLFSFNVSRILILTAVSNNLD